MRQYQKWLLLFGGLLQLGLAAACDDDGGGVDLNAKVSERRLCAEMAEIMCHNFYRCCRGGQIEADFGISLATTEEACRRDVALRCEAENAALLHSLGTGRVTLNEENINQCFDQYIAPDDDCFPMVSNFAEACRKPLVTGNQKLGKACLYDFECVDAGYCGTDRKCAPYPKEREKCEMSRGCAPGFYCYLNTNIDEHECAKRKPDNEGCNDSFDCQDGLVCKRFEEATTEGHLGICKPPKKVAESCEVHDECGTGFCLPALCEDGITSCYGNGDCPRYCDPSGIGCGGDGDCPGHCGDGTICLGNCPAECPRETCVTEPRCTGLGSCAKTYTEVDYCNLSLMSVFDCPPGQFRCDNYACIDPLYVCDGVYDCTDGSDELGATCGG